MKRTLSLACLFAAMLCACCEEDVPKPEDGMNVPGLPPASQSGANTIGFLLDGVPWTPEGPNNLSVDYDPGFNQGIIGIVAYRRILNGDNSGFSFGIRDSLNFTAPPRTYLVSPNGLGGVIFSDSSFCARISTDPINASRGYIQINKLDRTARIIAGTFEGTLFNPACGDTVRITKGRFDFKF